MVIMPIAKVVFGVNLGIIGLRLIQFFIAQSGQTTGITHIKLAKRFGVTQPAISYIINKELSHDGY